MGGGGWGRWGTIGMPIELVVVQKTINSPVKTNQCSTNNINYIKSSFNINYFFYHRSFIPAYTFIVCFCFRTLDGYL